MTRSRKLQYNVTNTEPLNEGNIDFTVKVFYVLNRALLVQFAQPAAGVGEEGEATTNWCLATPEQELNRINH
jgi:hypothetical protein